MFNYPGLGQLMISNITTKDFPVLHGAFLLIIVAVIVANKLADLTYPLIDPRIRGQGRDYDGRAHPGATAKRHAPVAAAHGEPLAAVANTPGLARRGDPGRLHVIAIAA